MTGNDFKNELENEIYKLRQKLHSILSNSQENDDMVLEVSRKLDVLIVKYYKSFDSVAV